MVEIEDRQRYTDPIDAGCAAAEMWIADKIAERRRKMEVPAQAFEIGRCRNCSDKLDDGRLFCDSDCCADFSERERITKRQWRFK